MEQNKESLKQQNTIRFIETTQSLIDDIGLKNISIRKIAEKAGFHNSTIYLYFKDVDELALLASLKHFNSYSTALAEHAKKTLPPRMKASCPSGLSLPDQHLTNQKFFIIFSLGSTVIT